jgi:hypothetical protein
LENCGTGIQERIAIAQIVNCVFSAFTTRWVDLGYQAVELSCVTDCGFINAELCYEIGFHGTVTVSESF